MPVELIEGFQEWSAGLPSSNLRLVVYPDGAVEIWQNGTPTNGLVETMVIQSFEDVATAATWFTDQDYGVQE